MKLPDRFLSENLMMSVAGHLLVVSALVTSIALVINRPKLVAPDRIQIMEIDLNAVKVSGDKTILYNVNADAKPEPVKPTNTEPAPSPRPEPIAEPKPIDTPSMVDDTESKKTEKEKPSNDKKVDDIETAPKKKTVVRVNRESVSLNRTLTVSVVDALRVAMTRCWVIDTRRPDVADIRAVAHLKMNRNGTVRDLWFESAARADSDPAFAYVLETIKNAINVCQPLRMLPENEFATWQDIILTFYPNTGTVM